MWGKRSGNSLKGKFNGNWFLDPYPTPPFPSISSHREFGMESFALPPFLPLNIFSFFGDPKPPSWPFPAGMGRDHPVLHGIPALSPLAVSPAAERLRYILGEEDELPNPTLFTEMDTLQHDGDEMEWKESAR